MGLGAALGQTLLGKGEQVQICVAQKYVVFTYKGELVNSLFILRFQKMGK